MCVLKMSTPLIISEISKTFFIFFKYFFLAAGFFSQLFYFLWIEISSFLGLIFVYDQNSILYDQNKNRVFLKRPSRYCKLIEWSQSLRIAFMACTWLTCTKSDISNARISPSQCPVGFGNILPAQLLTFPLFC